MHILDKIVVNMIHFDKHVIFVLYHEMSPNSMNNCGYMIEIDEH